MATVPDVRTVNPARGSDLLLFPLPARSMAASKLMTMSGQARPDEGTARSIAPIAYREEVGEFSVLGVDGYHLLNILTC